ncbi:MAG TPA: MarR family transcriptional regulator [Steroidobacteraceae bacterium]
MLTDRLNDMESTMRRVAALGLDFKPDELFLLRSLVLAGRAIAELQEDALHPFGLNESEYKVLVQLFAQPDGVGHPGDLCSGSHQSPANMTRITDSLVARELISRLADAQDRRRQVLRITPAGEALIRRAAPIAYAPLRQLLGQIPRKERESLQTQLRHIVAAIDAVQTAAPAAAGART